MRPFLSQWRAEFSLAMRQGEQLLVSVGIPLGILVFFSQIDVVRFDGVDAVDYLTPATMALAVMSTSMVSLGIGTGFDRNYGVLKRLGSTPLGRGRWLAAKVATVATIEVGQVAVLAMVGAALGWRPPRPGRSDWSHSPSAPPLLPGSGWLSPDAYPPWPTLQRPTACIWCCCSSGAWSSRSTSSRRRLQRSHTLFPQLRWPA